MTDPRIDKLAGVLVNYSVAVQPGDKVLVRGDAPASPLLKAVYAHVLQAGGHPLIMVSLPGTDELFFRYASDEQLQHVSEPLKLVMETYDATIRVKAASNTKSLSNIDPAKMVMVSRAHAEIMKTHMQRSAAGEFRWVSTIFPTNAYAQDAEMSLDEYEDFVYTACMPDIDDPVGYWGRFSTWQQKIVDWLKGKEQVHVIGPDTDLHLNIAGRSFINSDGKHNMPSGEVFTGPVEDSVEGYAYFSYPAIYQGREVTGVRLWFEKGRIVKATAKKKRGLFAQDTRYRQGRTVAGRVRHRHQQGHQPIHRSDPI